MFAALSIDIKSNRVRWWILQGFGQINDNYFRKQSCSVPIYHFFSLIFILMFFLKFRGNVLHKALPWRHQTEWSQRFNFICWTCSCTFNELYMKDRCQCDRQSLILFLTDSLNVDPSSSQPTLCKLFQLCVLCKQYWQFCLLYFFFDNRLNPKIYLKIQKATEQRKAKKRKDACNNSKSAMQLEQGIVLEILKVVDTGGFKLWLWN